MAKRTQKANKQSKEKTKAMQRTEERFWFKPKRYGYGATPITWEGWLLVLGFIGVVFLLALKAEKNMLLFLIEVLIITILLISISKRKTNAEWKWRWG